MFPSLACGVPVLYCGEGESAALIADAGAGIVAAPEDPHAIAEGIRAIVRDPAHRDTMAQNARRVAVERFAWGSIVDEWLLSMESEGTRRRRAHAAAIGTPP
jgi:glycosyltransferase involved in cell wall biosynthesis